MKENQTTRSSTTCIEWAAFRLRPGVSVAELEAASERLEAEFLRPSPGYLHRELLSGEAGQYVDLVHWRSRADAEALMSRAEHSRACQAYFALMDLEGSGPPSLFELRWAYSAAQDA